MARFPDSFSFFYQRGPEDRRFLLTVGSGKSTEVLVKLAKNDRPL